MLYQTTTITGPCFYDNGTAQLDLETLSGTENDTSAIVVTDGAELTMDDVTIVKHGYSSNLFQASFYGADAAIIIADASTAYISNSNIATHNGAANIFAFGNDTVVYANNSDLYSSGPTAHGLYASGNATIYGTNIRHYSGGNRCSSYAGDNPARYVYVTDSIGHTAGIGSAIFYALGEIHANNVLGYAENAPILFSDGPQLAEITESDLTAGLLAGTVMFSSMGRESGARLSLTNTRLTVKRTDMPGLWFGNIIASASLTSVELDVEASGILVIDNSSQVTQEFDYFAGGEQNSAIQAAEVTLDVSESDLTGDIVAYNGSSIALSLGNYSTWTGAAKCGGGEAVFEISLDKTSKWVLIGDFDVQSLDNEDESMGNIESNGFSIKYNSSTKVSKRSDTRRWKLNGGGEVTPL